MLNSHIFPLLNINSTEPYLLPLYRSYVIVQILTCKIPERFLLTGATCNRFSKVSRQCRCVACHPLQVFTNLLNLNQFTLITTTQTTSTNCKLRECVRRGGVGSE